MGFQEQAAAIAWQKYQEEQEKKEKSKKKKRTERPDEEPAIDTSHLADVEREQQREIEARVAPRELAPATQAIQSGFEAQRQAEQATQLIAEEAALYQENVKTAEDQIKMLESSPYLAGSGDSYYTIDGKPVTNADIAKMKQDLAEYKQDFRTWVSETGAQSILLKEKGKEVLSEVRSWSDRVVERDKANRRAKQEFNQELQQNIGFGGRKETRQQQLGAIPGPAAGPAPGSFGEKLRNQFGIPASKIVRKGLEATEKPFTAVTKPIRGLGESMIEKAVRQPSLLGTSAYLTGVGLGTVASAVDVATFTYRPGLQVETAKALGYLATDSETRKEFVKTIAKDPFKFTAEMVGGAYYGGKLASFGKKLYTERGPIMKVIKSRGHTPMWLGTKTTHGGFIGTKPMTLGETYRAVKAVMNRKTAQVDFNKMIETELKLYSYPEEYIQPEILESFTREPTYTVDSTFNKKFGKWEETLTDSDFALYQTQGSTVRTGKSGYLGFGKPTGGDLFQMVIPEEYAIPSFVYKYRKQLLNIPSIGAGPSIAEFAKNMMAPPINWSDLAKSTAIQVKQPSLTRTRTPQVQRPQTTQELNKVFLQKLQNINLNQTQVPDIMNIQIQPVTQKPIQIQRQKPIQIPGITPIQTTPPDFEENIRQFLTLPPPTTRKTKVTRIPREKKKKKKAKAGIDIGNILEFRVDPLKEIKIGRKKR